ncbi:MAG: UDP-N-acetylglucosamine 2-epimerase (non-hydrolyzing) [Muribaculaceae bacterium]|nr:UDP-N-acetylglucosamine 2-epimerase (non-hydrolyzing) [Muribaculaceae bacterium]
MIKLLTVIGARPQIIKAAAISRAVKMHFADKVQEKILHTGQHYDQNMSQVFIDELGIPQPDYNLGVGSGRHGEQTAKMLAGIEQVLLGEQFDGIVLYGDTNSTLAGAVAASKIHIPIFHIEAGLRSFNMAMPEEVNRIVCDQLASILFPPTETGMSNLIKEGFVPSRAKFKNGKGRIVVNCGDVMYDNSIHFATLAKNKSDIIQQLNLEPNNYVLATIHRDNNTDDPKRLTAIFEALMDIAERESLRVVLPLHPRTAKLLPANLESLSYDRLKNHAHISLIPPASFFDIIELERNARLVMTDSGGVQKEAFFFERPCVILRPETEWLEIVEHQAGIIADADYHRIIDAYDHLTNVEITFPKLFGDGNAAQHIMQTIVDYLIN